METSMIRGYIVEYDHKDGRSGKIKVITEVRKREGSYGNGKSGALTVGDYTRYYDLRYNKEKDLHMLMIRDYFGDGLVNVNDVGI